MRRIERQVIDKAEAMDNPYGAVVALIRGDTPILLRCLDLLEQRGMAPFFDTQDVVQTMRVQGLDVGSMRTQTIVGDDELEVGMILAQLGHKALGSITFAIILGPRVGVFAQSAGRHRPVFASPRVPVRKPLHLPVSCPARRPMWGGSRRRESPPRDWLLNLQILTSGGFR
jgi:hypothetical protein